MDQDEHFDAIDANLTNSNICTNLQKECLPNVEVHTEAQDYITIIMNYNKRYFLLLKCSLL